LPNPLPLLIALEKKEWSRAETTSLSATGRAPDCPPGAVEVQNLGHDQ